MQPFTGIAQKPAMWRVAYCREAGPASFESSSIALKATHRDAEIQDVYLCQ